MSRTESRTRGRDALRGGLALAAWALLWSTDACKRDPAPAQTAAVADADNGPDPAAANLAAVEPETGTSAYIPPPTPVRARVLGQRGAAPQLARGESYPGTSAQPYDSAYDEYERQAEAGQQALYAAEAPPPLPVYTQPELTEANDQWTPGYWSYGSGGYFWVPGAWVAPPYAGALWTPGYWAREGSRYRFHRGFWGRHVGFYGGVPYGFGYTGQGYEGGYWNGDSFFYNRAVNRVDQGRIRSLYTRNVAENRGSGASYNGAGGWEVRPRPAELAALREERLPLLPAQARQAQQAAQDRRQFFAENHGRPATITLAQRLVPAGPLPRAIAPVRPGYGQGQAVEPGVFHPPTPGAPALDQQQQQRERQAEQRQTYEQLRATDAQQRGAQQQAAQQRAAQAEQRQTFEQIRANDARQAPSFEQRRAAQAEQRQTYEQQRQQLDREAQQRQQGQRQAPQQERSQPEQHGERPRG